jgi:hypothetical protein
MFLPHEHVSNQHVEGGNVIIHCSIRTARTLVHVLQLFSGFPTKHNPRKSKQT